MGNISAQSLILCAKEQSLILCAKELCWGVSPGSDDQGMLHPQERLWGFVRPCVC